MLALLSPSKTLDFETYRKLGDGEIPALFNESKKLLKILKTLSAKDIAKLMDISPKLSELNYKRFQEFSTRFNEDNSQPAVIAFKGDVYEGLNADDLTLKELKIAQKKIAIISGLYGLIRPFELIQPYRLEMGTKLKNDNGKDLYSFWGDKISNAINQLESKIIINLASQEYFKAVNVSQLKAEVIDINFMENKSGKYKVIALFAKRARGLMARYMIKNNISKIEGLKDFDYEDYKFSPKLSSDNKLTFIRG